MGQGKARYIQKHDIPEDTKKDDSLHVKALL